MQEKAIGCHNILILQIHTECFYPLRGIPQHQHIGTFAKIGEVASQTNGLKDVQIILVVGVCTGALDLAQHGYPKLAVLNHHQGILQVTVGSLLNGLLRIAH